jgi:hypothetical protein
MSLSPLDLGVQLPADKRKGQIIAGSSTRQQAAREADAVGQLGPWYINWLLSRRQEQERKRAEKRRTREARWRGRGVRTTRPHCRSGRGAVV